MPSFLIVHSATADGRIDRFLQPPMLEIDGLHAPLDWGDITMHVPAGDLPLTISVTRADGVVEGARITVRTPAGTGTRLTFIPPSHPGAVSQLRIEGQWPADSSMHYYAARDGRVLVPGPARIASIPSAPRPAASAIAPSAPPAASSPPVGPAPGSTGSVPERPTHFGHAQGSRVEPTVANGTAEGVSSPAAPSFGQRSPAEHDVYGRALGPEGQAPAIPTPADFDRLEREAAEAQRRAYEAWRAQQPPRSVPAGAGAHDGAPQPVGLPAAGPGQVPPDWYVDPFRRADARWFDGREWTSSVLRAGMRAHDQPG